MGPRDALGSQSVLIFTLVRNDVALKDWKVPSGADKKLEIRLDPLHLLETRVWVSQLL